MANNLNIANIKNKPNEYDGKIAIFYDKVKVAKDKEREFEFYSYLFPVFFGDKISNVILEIQKELEDAQRNSLYFFELKIKEKNIDLSTEVLKELETVLGNAINSISKNIPFMLKKVSSEINSNTFLKK